MKAIKLEIVINSIRSRKDRSVGFSAETPELTNEERNVFFDLQGINATMLLEPLDEGISEVLEVGKDVENKSQAQRMRAIYFLIWKQKGEQGQFRDYYYNKTEKIINYLKGKLE